MQVASSSQTVELQEHTISILNNKLDGILSIFGASGMSGERRRQRSFQRQHQPTIWEINHASQTTLPIIATL